MNHRPHLRVVVSNGDRNASTVQPGRDFAGLARNARHRLAYLVEFVVTAWGVVVLPFRAAAAVWRFIVGMGTAIVSGFVSFAFACIGLSVASMAFYMVYQFFTRY